MTGVMAGARSIRRDDGGGLSVSVASAMTLPKAGELIRGTDAASASPRTSLDYVSKH